jgi:Zn-dependent peptidase ImmA (M78 family)
MTNEAVKKTFDILKKKGVTKEFLYKNAETKDSFNISLQGLCDELGIKIVVKNNLTDENGKTISGKSDCEKKIIYINGSDIGERMRFALGHELYHVLNSSQNEEKNENNKFSENELNANANAFSAELLIPEDILKKKIKDWGIDVARLAIYFKASVPAMFYRLTNLGFLLK